MLLQQLLLLLLLRGSCSTPQLPAHCPDFVSEYAAWHAAGRQSPAARHLTLECPPLPHQGGLGDRLRGVLYAFRVAMKHSRLLFINWEGSFDLEVRAAAALAYGRRDAHGNPAHRASWNLRFSTGGWPAAARARSSAPRRCGMLVLTSHCPTES